MRRRATSTRGHWTDRIAARCAQPARTPRTGLAGTEWTGAGRCGADPARARSQDSIEPEERETRRQERKARGQHREERGDFGLLLLHRQLRAERLVDLLQVLRRAGV